MRALKAVFINTIDFTLIILGCIYAYSRLTGFMAFLGIVGSLALPIVYMTVVNWKPFANITENENFTPEEKLHEIEKICDWNMMCQTWTLQIFYIIFLMSC